MEPGLRDSQKTRIESSSMRVWCRHSWLPDFRTTRFDASAMILFVEFVGVIEAVAQAIEDLFDGKQCDEYPAYRDRGVQRGDRRQRRHAKAGKAAQKVEIPENDKAYRYSQHDEPDEDFDDDAGSAMKPLRDRREIKMVIAARRRRGAEEDCINEQGRRHLL